MPFLDLDYVLSPVFLLTFGLTLGTFVPLLWSLWITWQENKHKERELIEEQRRLRRRRRVR